MILVISQILNPSRRVYILDLLGNDWACLGWDRFMVIALGRWSTVLWRLCVFAVYLVTCSWLSMLWRVMGIVCGQRSDIRSVMTSVGHDIRVLRVRRRVRFVRVRTMLLLQDSPSSEVSRRDRGREAGRAYLDLRRGGVTGRLVHRWAGRNGKPAQAWSALPSGARRRFTGEKISRCMEG